MMRVLSSYLSGEWVSGNSEGRALVNATSGELIARASTDGLDLRAAVVFARSEGGRALRAMTFAQRGAMLKVLSVAIHEHREELLDLSCSNGGTTRRDGKFDIDGASGTMGWYAALGKRLGEQVFRLDGAPASVLRSKRFMGQHLFVAREGVAFHLNAFNFPAWGMAEKAAVAWLAGMPVIAKPGTSTALVAHRIAEIWEQTGVLPKGAFSLLCGSVSDLLDHAGPQDCVAFTGGSDTARRIRSHSNLISHNVRINIEADSLNAAVLAPDADPESDTYRLFISQVVTDLTQKAGQKCTATRRVFVPESHLEEVVDSLKDALFGVVVGDPSNKETTIAPVSSPAQLRHFEEGKAQLSAVSEEIWAVDSPKGGCFVSPALYLTKAGLSAEYAHDHEVFGPVATVFTYDGSAAKAVQLVARGGGGLVASLFSDDIKWAKEVILGLAPWHGRLFWGSKKIASQSPGAGTVLPDFLHGGPGRAGGGQELGGERGLDFYSQRVAIQGDRALLDRILS